MFRWLRLQGEVLVWRGGRGKDSGRGREGGGSAEEEIEVGHREFSTFQTSGTGWL